jgi:YegS/Rv2252/BmrU family lipid kinase
MDNRLPDHPRTLILFNPHAGQANNLMSQLERAADLWRDRGWQVELCPTQYAGHATYLARDAAAQGYDIVAAAGGDGTVNEVVNGLVNTQTALAVLPIGTVNIWARELGLSMDIQQAADAFLQARLEQIDVGRAGDRYFLLMAGIGFDAAVTAEIRSDEKKRFGAIAYLKQAVQLAWQFRGSRAKIYLDGRRIRGCVLMVVIGNSQLYGGVVKFTSHAVVDDGVLDVCVIKGQNMLVAPLRLFSVFAKQFNRGQAVEYYQAQQIQIRGKQHLPVQVDGDYLGSTPLTVSVVPAGLWALVPPSADRSLWKSTSETKPALLF